MKNILLAVSLLLWPCTARAGSFDFVKLYAGTWWGSGSSNFGSFAIRIDDAGKRDGGTLKFNLKTNGKVFDGSATLSEPTPGKNSIQLSRRKNGGDYKNMEISIIESKPGSCDMTYEIHDGGELIKGRLVLNKTAEGRYKTDIYLPDNITIAGLPMPLSPKVSGDLTISATEFNGIFYVLPGIRLTLNATTNKTRKNISFKGALLFYNVSGTIKRK